jgi:hypothetical protein
MRGDPLPNSENEFWRAVCIERCKHGSEGGCWKSTHNGNSSAAYPTWYASEFDGHDIFFGLVIGFEMELGYFSLSELSSVHGGLGLPIERDRYFTPTSLQELKVKHEQERNRE